MEKPIQISEDANMKFSVIVDCILGEKSRLPFSVFEGLWMYEILWIWPVGFLPLEVYASAVNNMNPREKRAYIASDCRQHRIWWEKEIVCQGRADGEGKGLQGALTGSRPEMKKDWGWPDGEAGQKQRTEPGISVEETSVSQNCNECSSDLHQILPENMSVSVGPQE